MSVRTLKKGIEIIKQAKDLTRAEKSELLGVILAVINAEQMRK